MSEEKKAPEASEEKKSLSTPVLVALISLFGIVITGVFSVINTLYPLTLSAKLTQTAEASLGKITPTATFYPTSTPEMPEPLSATPEPKVYFVLPKVDELTSLPLILSEYLKSETPSFNSYTVEVGSNETYRWKYYWCATSQDLLANNLQQMEFDFLVDDIKIPEESFLLYEIETERWTCQAWSTMLTQWQQGNTVTLSVAFTIPRPMSDGEKTYQPGEYRHDIIVTVE